MADAGTIVEPLTLAATTVATMTDMAASADQTPTIPTLANFRDLGGLSAAGGEVRPGQLFRSGHLADLSDADRATVDGLGLGVVFDFRTTGEAQKKPDPAVAGAAGVHLDILADAELAVPANLVGLFADPKTAAKVSEQLATSDVRGKLAQTYRGLVNLDSARTGYSAFFGGLAASDAPALFHCTAGKDRTGWGAAALLTLLGVGRDDVYADYLLTNELFLPTFGELFASFAEAGGDAELLRPVLGVEEAFLDAAFDEVDREYGSIATYFTAGLGVDTDTQRALRDRYVG